MSALTRAVTLEAARAALSSGDFRRAAELYAVIQIEDELRAVEPVGGVQ